MKRIMKKLTAVTLVLAVMLAVMAISPAARAAGEPLEAGVVSVSYGSLNVRAAASTSSSILTRLPKGAYVTLLSQSGGFFRVEYAPSAYGYVYAAYIGKVPGTYAATVATAWGSLNVRTGAGTSHTVKATLPKGKRVVVLSASNGWSRILYNGTQLGYVSSAYLKTDAVASTMVWPTESTEITRPFTAGSHLGIDIAPRAQGVAGDAVFAAAPGTVAYSGYLNGYGYVVYINSYVNGQYIQTRYAHLKSASGLQAGDMVGAGQTVGYMGSTGTSSGVHLHFEVRVRGSSGTCLANSESTPVNPLNYVAK